MQSRDQCGELIFINVLELVYEHYQCLIGALGRLSDLFQKRCEVALQVPVVCQSFLGFEIEANLYVLELDL